MKKLVILFALLMSFSAYAVQIESKFIKDSAVSTAKIAADAVTGAKIRLANQEFLKGRNAADSGNINIVKVNGTDQIEFSALPLGPSSAPGADYIFANKKYVDDAVSGIPASKTWFRETLTLTAGNVLAQYVDASQNCVLASVRVSASGTDAMVGASDDITLSTVSSKARITFATNYATAGQSELLEGDKLQVQCQY